MSAVPRRGMTPRRRLSRCLLSALMSCAALAGCGSDGARAPATSSSPAVLESCAGAGAGWHVVPNKRVSAAALGSGPVVVFANDSGNSACSWLPIAQTLAGLHLRVVLFTYFDASEADSVGDLLALAKSAGGSGHFALVGASLGGRLVIESAGRHPAGLAAIVSLSGERAIQPAYPDILAQARQVRTPALYVGSTEDPLTAGRQQQLELHNAMQGRPNELLQLVGFDHGTDLLALAAPDGHTVTAHVAAFLQAQLR